jgi:flavin-dependent dehydrogenase
MIRKIVIVGGGSSGWMTAAHLATHTKGIQISLIESSDIPVIGVGESTVPPMVDFMAGLGIQEEEWMPKCNATYKSSICFSEFHAKGDPLFWYPFIPMGMVEGRPTSRYWMHKHRTDKAYADRFSFYDYCTIVPELCRQGKTVKSVFNHGYAYHVDAGLLGQYLKELSKSRGVEHVVDTITEARMREDGGIKAVARKNGPDLEGDLFIDCSGFRSLLLGQALNEPFDSYSDYLFNDTAIAARLPYIDPDKEMISYTMCSAQSSGWVWQVPIYNRLGTGYVYSSAHKSADEAEKEFRQFLGEDRTKDISMRQLKMRVGKQRRSWVKNCIAVGLSGGFVEPLESTGLFIVQGALDVITELLKTKHDYTIADVTAFNASVDRLYEIIRDFLVCHYALTSREDSPYWKDVKYTTKISDSLADKLQLARTRFPDLEFLHMFDNAGLAGFNFNDGWQYILAGMNYLPFDYKQVRDRQTGPFEPHIKRNMPRADKLQAQYAQQRQQIPNLPSHYQFLKNGLFKGKDVLDV